VSDEAGEEAVAVSNRRTDTVDLALMTLVAVTGALAAVASFRFAQPIISVAVVGLTAVALDGVYARMRARLDHLRAMQSHQVLEIASESLAYLRRGLNRETAGAVCRLALAESEASAVAITDTENVLGFAGLGEEHHTVGGPIMTRATREAIEENEHRILSSREEIGCSETTCRLESAIVVPLEMRGAPVGTLKFYYTSADHLTESQVAMVEGLGHLLSTQLELSELERQTALAYRMELKALQAQINPHFLFNTINTIASLIRTDPPAAREILREFAAFYRRTLENAEELITFEKELEYTRQYMHFEQARFGERIRLAEDVPQALLGTLVPAFILQPLVENAVQHGMPPEGALHIRVTAELENGLVAVHVTDDGVGIPEDDLPKVLDPGFGRGLGIALKNVDDRLKGHFGPCCGLSVVSREGEGTTVTLTIAPTPVERGG
jgi:two-component system sensor histidine kinase LytS